MPRLPLHLYKNSYMIRQFEDDISVILAFLHYYRWSLSLANCVCISVAYTMQALVDLSLTAIHVENTERYPASIILPL